MLSYRIQLRTAIMLFAAYVLIKSQLSTLFSSYIVNICLKEYLCYITGIFMICWRIELSLLSLNRQEAKPVDKTFFS